MLATLQQGRLAPIAEYTDAADALRRRSRERISEPLDLHLLATSVVPFDRDAFIAALVDESCERYRAEGLYGAGLAEFVDGHGFRFVFDGAGAADGSCARAARGGCMGKRAG